MHKQQKYRCGRCGHIEAALAPKRFLPGGRYDLSFVVQVALDKYLYHLPLERQVRRMGRREIVMIVSDFRCVCGWEPYQVLGTVRYRTRWWRVVGRVCILINNSSSSESIVKI